MPAKSFKGNLEILNLSDIFQSLAMNRHSGTLIVNDGKREKKIFFAEGEISLLSSGKRQRLGDMLIAAGKITAEDLDLALKLQKQSRKKLGEILVEEGFCEQSDIEALLRQQIEEEIYDLFLWREQHERTYDIDLGDTRVNVKVVFMDDFLSHGWSSFATLGHARAGGWATREALFCKAEDYDVESESFKISYLRHEGRHFADYKQFPALTVRSGYSRPRWPS